MPTAYLDNNATTRCDPRVVEAMMPYFSEQFGNASSMHEFGAKVGDAVSKARKQLQALIGAPFDHEIIYTSGGTESDNMAILSALETQRGRDEIVTSAVEHPAVLSLVAHLEKTERAKVHIIPVDSAGRLDMEAYRKALSPKTAIVSIMWANNETGTIFPVEQLARMAHQVGALFHTDAVQAVGKLPINLAESEIDMLSLSGHKLHGPKGIGALFVRKGVRSRPLIRGGHQERGRRAGTENVPGIVGLGKAAELAAEYMQEEQTRVAALRDWLERSLLQAIPNSFVTGDVENRLPNTTNIAFEYIEGEAILLLMNREGIAASSGSACTSGSLEPSHVLRAMNVPYTAAHGAIRFSFSRENSEGDVEQVIAAMPGIIEKLRDMSPFWRERENASSAEFNPTYA
ncbi:cysteine desulfurase NifS [Alteraurantiacibacter aquimixticola]|uniref:Cysteine desulfurase n=1 Tax=Alteraurantiacibacter aquimixticola TaxID=2489173 RepID=A0A4T3F5I1_9SPHN|nr:cysteine desulfurase NifS [Alteraurantiacibacter aquimixticola]TIX51644.1 cysteine desulfurase NifS [Alteraurantiacibacter aquimixticola]